MEQISFFADNEEQNRKNPPSSFSPPDDGTGIALQELSVDIEATGRDPMSDTIVGVALCKERGKAYYVPLRHTGDFNLDNALSMLKSILEDPSVAKIGHNLKYDFLLLRQEEIRVKGFLYDTMVASYLLNPNKPDHSLEEATLQYLSHKKKSFTEVLGKRRSFEEVPVEEATAYAAEDAELAFELKDILFERLKAEGLETVYAEIEMPLITVLVDIEEAGILIDKDRLTALSKELDRELETLQSRIYRLAGEEFNINSPKQLSRILFETLGLKPLKKTKTGFSTGVDILEELSKAHELPTEILNYRTFFKLKTTYVDTLPKLINRKTGRVHTSFNQTVTATGRLSSSDPNLQNIPIRGDWGRRIREVFVADQGCLLLSADYSQVELRILAHMSNDRGLIEAFSHDVDIHTRTASELFGVPQDQVTQDLRRIAKTVNFGVIYGISPYGLSEALDISQRDAASFIEQYFEKHGGVKKYIDDTLQYARTNGYVTTITCRKRPVPEINSPNPVTRQQAERMATNSPIQGSAADLIKVAMINIAKRLSEKNLGTRMVLQIHDELLFEVPEQELEEVKTLIKHEMENSLLLSVPITVEVGYGKNWAEAH